MRVYVAAPWVFKDEAGQVAFDIAVAGHVITSVWHRDHQDNHDPVILAREAQEDFMGIVSADALVVLNKDTLSEGKAVEQGIAISYAVPIIAIGSKQQNIFQYLPVVTLVPTLADAIDILARWEARP